MWCERLETGHGLGQAGPRRGDPGHRLCAAMNILTRRAWNAERDIPEQYPSEMTKPAPRGQAKPRVRKLRKRKFGRTVPQAT